MGKHIPFIYNYCDRWCERCGFTASCAIYENEKDLTEEEKGIQNDAFGDKISNNLEDAHEALVQIAMEHGIDLNKIPQEELDAIGKEMEEKRRQVKADDLVILCQEYLQMSRNVMQNETLWKQKGDEMIEQEKLGTVSLLELEDQLRLLKECREIIQWYQFFIQVKFMRAVSGLISDYECERGEIQTDYNGSAKIALIAVDRSQQAWTQLFNLIPEEDIVLPILSLLTRIENAGNKRFPDAKKFIRPGFDELEKIEIPDSRTTPKPGMFVQFQYGKRG